MFLEENNSEGYNHQTNGLPGDEDSSQHEQQLEGSSMQSFDLNTIGDCFDVTSPVAPGGDEVMDFIQLMDMGEAGNRNNGNCNNNNSNNRVLKGNIGETQTCNRNNNCNSSNNNSNETFSLEDFILKPQSEGEDSSAVVDNGGLVCMESPLYDVTSPPSSMTGGDNTETFWMMNNGLYSGDPSIAGITAGGVAELGSPSQFSIASESTIAAGIASPPGCGMGVGSPVIDFQDLENTIAAGALGGEHDMGSSGSEESGKQTQGEVVVKQEKGKSVKGGDRKTSSNKRKTGNRHKRVSNENDATEEEEEEELVDENDLKGRRVNNTGSRPNRSISTSSVSSASTARQSFCLDANAIDLLCQSPPSISSPASSAATFLTTNTTTGNTVTVPTQLMGSSNDCPLSSSILSNMFLPTYTATPPTSTAAPSPRVSLQPHHPQLLQNQPPIAIVPSTSVNPPSSTSVGNVAGNRVKPIAPAPSPSSSGAVSSPSATASNNESTVHGSKKTKSGNSVYTAPSPGSTTSSRKSIVCEVPEIKGEDVSGLSKQKLRLIKNRHAASLSRQKKKAHLDGLEAKVRETEEANTRLKEEVAEVRNENESLKSELQHLRNLIAMNMGAEMQQPGSKKRKLKKEVAGVCLMTVLLSFAFFGPTISGLFKNQIGGGLGPSNYIESHSTGRTLMSAHGGDGMSAVRAGDTLELEFKPPLIPDYRESRNKYRRGLEASSRSGVGSNGELMAVPSKNELQEMVQFARNRQIPPTTTTTDGGNKRNDRATTGGSLSSPSSATKELALKSLNPVTAQLSSVLHKKKDTSYMICPDAQYIWRSSGGGKRNSSLGTATGAGEEDEEDAGSLGGDLKLSVLVPLHYGSKGDAPGRAKFQQIDCVVENISEIEVDKSYVDSRV
eukprot:Nk52_evm32s228 gene=Nk52_evmTU32s228